MTTKSPYTKFNRVDHVYSNVEFSEIVKDAVRFFAGTPVQPLPPAEKFHGTGVYLLYYVGKCPIYERFSEINRLSHSLPIYVGKAVPKGWRQSRVSDGDDQFSGELNSRLREHAASINAVKELNVEDFSCRFVIFEQESSDMISTVEAALIKIHVPLWNSIVDGFGNHDPGKGRYNQARSDWDVLHPGRKWSIKCKGHPNSMPEIEAKIKHYFNGYRA